MAWSFVAASSVVATGANPSPAVPTGYAAGDLLVFVHSSSTSSGANNPSGYTNLVRNTTASPFLAVWWKIAGASESAVSITNADASTKATVLCYRSVDTSAADATGTIATGTTTAATTNTVSTSKANDLVLNIFGGGKTASSTGTWSGGSANSRANSGSSTTLSALYCTDELQAASGTSTARTGTLSRASTGTQGVTIAFKSSTYTSTGALTGGGAAVSGTAARQAAAVTHATSGTLTGSGAAVVGSASRFRTMATSGTLTGQGAAIVGSADRQSAAEPVTHDTSGVLTGQGSTVVGSAARTRVHPTTGVLSGSGAIVVGEAVHQSLHTTSGALTGQGSTLSGSATRFRAHDVSGALTGPGSIIVGEANHSTFVAHDTFGALTGQGSVISGTALHNIPHDTSGALQGAGAVIVGSAFHSVLHDAIGALIGQGSVLSGEARHNIPHDTSGALTGDGSVVNGVAQRIVTHDTSGVLVGAGSVITGDADRASFADFVAQAVLAALMAQATPVNIVEVNDVLVTGDGQTGTEWGPTAGSYGYPYSPPAGVADIVNAVLALINATKIPVDIKQVNSIDVQGDGQLNTPWGPV